MTTNTSIEWTDTTWNPVTGCTKVSQGCKNCYAERLFPRPYPGRKFTDVRTHGDRLLQPMSWRTGRRVFVNSMSDLFHESVPFEFIAAVFGIMAVTPRHTYQILTKRPQQALRFFAWMGKSAQAVMHEAVKGELGYHHPKRPAVNESRWPLPNVWLGVSCEDQPTADERIPLLMELPAAIRFLSLEPLLGPIDLNAIPARAGTIPLNGATLDDCRGCLPRWQASPMRAKLRNGVDWVIVGGESGHRPRPMNISWAVTILVDCHIAGVPAFLKQLGARVNWDDNHPARPIINAKGGDMREWPEALRVREFPEVA